jgi:hypothetical protein
MTKLESGYLQAKCIRCRKSKGVNEGAFYGHESRFVCFDCSGQDGLRPEKHGTAWTQPGQGNPYERVGFRMRFTCYACRRKFTGHPFLLSLPHDDVYTCDRCTAEDIQRIAECK